MPSKNYASTRFSSLTEITPGERQGPRSRCSRFSLAVNKGQEAAPIVADNTMYIVTAYPNYVYALDLTQAGRAAEMEVRAAARYPPARAWRAATWSTAAALSTTANTSSIRWTARPSRSM